jgi:hypothetical protein
MSERKRILLLISIMATVSLTIGGIAILLLYRTALEEEKARLVETAQSQARLIEAVTRFDSTWSRNYPGGSEQATLSQISDAHGRYKGFGDTGEFTLAKRHGRNISFLLRHRHSTLDTPEPIQFASKLAEPMRRALSGQSGAVVALDYSGEEVLAAHEPVAELDLGIVAKIDMTEVRTPFLIAGAIAGSIGLLVVLAGATLFVRVSNPMIRRLEQHSTEMTKANDQLKQEI